LTCVFSFDGYYGGKQYSSFGPLHVLNEDKIKPQRGFGKHSHHNYEIFTYMLAGTLEHQDSFDNVEQISRGMVQLTSAGSGIAHSEMNKGDKYCHLLQVCTFCLPYRSPLLHHHLPHTRTDIAATVYGVGK
jgi:redox-sensitive bicupin YhaK (pirin superfamily)